MPLEITLRQSLTVAVTATSAASPQLVLAARVAGDNRSYLKFFDLDGTNTIMIAPQIGGTVPATGYMSIAASSEFWDNAGAIPGNAFWAYLSGGTSANLTVWEG